MAKEFSTTWLTCKGAKGWFYNRQAKRLHGGNNKQNDERVMKEHMLLFKDHILYEAQKV